MIHITRRQRQVLVARENRTIVVVPKAAESPYARLMDDLLLDASLSDLRPSELALILAMRDGDFSLKGAAPLLGIAETYARKKASLLHKRTGHDVVQWLYVLGREDPYCDADPIKDWRGPSAVYRLFSAANRLLYVGASYEPERRIEQHKWKPWGGDVARSEIEWHETRQAALDAETAAIGSESPAYNIRGTG